MSDSLYVATSGLRETMIAQSVHSNNLANLRTPGFRADLYNAQSLSLNGENGLQTKAYATHSDNTVDLRPGPIIATGNDLDVAIDGEGLLAVLGPDGQEAYTRAGNLKIGNNGQLLTGGGHVVQGAGGPIALPPAQKIEFGKDGTISIVPQGSTDGALSVVNQLKLVSHQDVKLVKNEHGLLRAENNQPLPISNDVSVTSGALEGSNVNPIESMVSIISLARQFEVQLKLANNSKENSNYVAQLLQNN